MTDEQFGPVVSSWLQAENSPPPDPNGSVRRVMTVAQQTRQLRRWRWLPPFVHGLPAPPPAPPTTEQTSTYVPTSIPATNGHSPTVSGRTQSMLSPAKAITAGAVIFAIGGVLLIAQPFDQQGGSVPGAATDAEVAPPVEVTATTAGGPCSPATVEEDGNVVRERGYTCQSTYTWSDPRLNGAVTAGWNQDNYTDESGLSIETFALSIENDDGGWRMRPIPSVQFPDAVEVGAEVWVLDGEGEYEGLTAVLLVEGFTPHGFIIEGDIPSPPENASTK